MAKKVFSLKYKMILVVLLVSVGGLSAYAFVTLNTFLNDKKKYLYDSSEIVVRTLATQVRWEIDAIKNILKPVEESLDQNKFRFTAASSDFFLKQERLEHIYIYLPTTGESFQEMDHLYLPNRTVRSFSPGGEVIEALLMQAMDKGFAVQEVKSNKRFFVLVNKHKSKTIKRDYLTLSVFQSVALYESFVTPTTYKNFLLSKSKFLSMGPKYRLNKSDQFEIGNMNFFDPILANRLPTGIAEISNFSGEQMLVSFAKVGISDLLVVAVAEKNKVMGIVKEIKYKSILFLISMLSFSIFIGVLSTNGIVNSLKKLSGKVNLMKAGNYGKSLPINSSDEVAELTEAVNELENKLK
ncbi:MAG: hypothetical protein HOO06_05815 [Bdellovibrionaceae bacterium]|jgi:hypothetical protein|nr:hypothetical protein [Pseudobdellovibrionaceae bacterium]